MSKKRLVLALLLTVFVGNLVGLQIGKKTPKLCYPCTTYCKTHPNAPRCN